MDTSDRRNYQRSCSIRVRERVEQKYYRPDGRTTDYCLCKSSKNDH